MNCDKQLALFFARIATTMAMVSRTVTSAEAGHRRLDICDYRDCIACASKQPVNGKFLRCLHIVCTECLEKSSDYTKGLFVCPECYETTTNARRNLYELKYDLSDCPAALWTGNSCDSSDAVETRTCDACRRHTATVSCDDCLGRPLCLIDSEEHVRKPCFSSHTIYNLSDDPQPCNNRKGRVPSGLCWLDNHSFRPLIMYCHDCRSFMCQKCWTTGTHSDHTVQSIKGVARSKRRALEELRKGDTTARKNANSRPEASNPMEGIFVSLDNDSKLVNESVNEVKKRAEQAYSQATTLINQALANVNITGNLRAPLLGPYVDLLGSYLDCERTALYLCKHLPSKSEISDDHFMYLVNNTEEILAQLKEALPCLQKVPQPGPIAAEILAPSSCERLSSLVITLTSVAFDGHRMDKERLALSQKDRRVDTKRAGFSREGNHPAAKPVVAVAQQGYTTGIKKWCVYVGTYNDPQDLMDLGVGVVFLDAGTSKSEIPSVMQGFAGVGFTGSGTVYGAVPGHCLLKNTQGPAKKTENSQWATGDVLQLHLDFGKAYLCCYRYNVGDRQVHLPIKINIAIGRNQVVYPSVIFTRFGQFAEIFAAPDLPD